MSNGPVLMARMTIAGVHPIVTVALSNDLEHMAVSTMEKCKVMHVEGLDTGDSPITFRNQKLTKAIQPACQMAFSPNSDRFFVVDFENRLTIVEVLNWTICQRLELRVQTGVPLPFQLHPSGLCLSGHKLAYRVHDAIYVYSINPDTPRKGAIPNSSLLERFLHRRPFAVELPG